MCLKYRESGTRAQLQQLSLHSSPHPNTFSSILCLFSLFLLHATYILPLLLLWLPSSSSSFSATFSFSTTTTFISHYYFNLLLLPSSSSLLPLRFLQSPSFSSTLFLFLFFHLLLPFSSFIFHPFLSLQSQSHPSALYFLHESLGLNAETQSFTLNVTWHLGGHKMAWPWYNPKFRDTAPLLLSKCVRACVCVCVLPRSSPTVLFSLLGGQLRPGMLCVLLDTGICSIRSLVDAGLCLTRALVGYRNWAYDTDWDRKRERERESRDESSSDHDNMYLWMSEGVFIYPAVGLQLKALQPRQHLQGGGDVSRRVSPPRVV